MGEIKQKEGKKGPYYMVNVAGVVYASSNEEDVKSFLSGEEVDMVQSGETWFWVKQKGTPRKQETVERKDNSVREKIKSLASEIHELAGQL